MKRTVKVILALMICVCATLSFASCDYKFGHNYYDTLSYDDTTHWYDCTGIGCDSRKDVVEHELVDGYAVADGVTYVGKVCTECEYTRVTTETVVALDEDSFKDAVAEGGEIELGDDIVISEALEIAEGVEVKLDLNGKTVRSNGDAQCVIMNNGTLVISGDGTLVSESTNAVRNFGELTINGGTYTSEISYAINNQGGSVTVNSATADSVGGIYTSQGSVVIEAGTFMADDTSASYRKTLYADNSEVTINGGTFYHYGNTSVIGSSGSSVVKVNGGEIIGGTGYVIEHFSGGTIEINDGSITGIVRFINNGVTKITGGNINFIKNGTYYNNGTITVSGGTYSGFDLSPYVASGYEALDNGNGTWTVSPVED